ncbi:MAG: hypothetical protein ACLFSY_07815 [Desulfonatronovibrionaceae bacterium]
MFIFVLLRDVIILVAGVCFFEFYLDFQLPEEDNLLLYFVAIPIIWATLSQIWTSVSYSEQKNRFMYALCHVIGVLMLISTVFLISAVLNSIEASLSLTGNIFFHFVGWTVLIAFVFYDLVDIL